MILNIIFRMTMLPGSRAGANLIVCHCHAVTEGAVRTAVRDGARCRRSVAQACSAGRSCGGCALLVDEIIECESRGERTHAVARVELAATG
jgi:bacterioferritin-associated ferredoxin